MSRTTYGEKLRDPRWQKRRLEMMSLAGWKCQQCDNPHEELHVHHVKYTKGREPWEYADDELQVLCAACHSAEHPSKPKRSNGTTRKIAGRFTMLSNSVGRDARLSYCARGILLMASTHSNRWVFNVKSINDGSPKEGKVTIGNAIKELKRFGYLTMKRVYADGRFTGCTWHWDFNAADNGGEL